MVYEFMVALAANSQAVDNESSIEKNAQYVLSMALTLADKFEASLIESGGK